MNRIDPNLWQLPPWHKDWDGEFQFSQLRTFAETLHGSTDLDAMLSIIEVGYARLEVFDEAMCIGLLYVNRTEDASTRSFTLYAGANDDETTTVELAAGVEFLSQRRSMFPKESENPST